MTDYANLIPLLRLCSRQGTRYGYAAITMADAADAIEALNHLVDFNTERCEGLRKQLREAQDGYEKHLNELQAEVKRLKESNEELREKQTYIDHYGDKWMTSAKNVPNAAYNHGYADGRDEQLPKHGEWIEHGEPPMLVNECSVCGSLWCGVGGYIYCPNCGAKMGDKE